MKNDNTFSWQKMLLEYIFCYEKMLYEYTFYYEKMYSRNRMLQKALSNFKEPLIKARDCQRSV